MKTIILLLFPLFIIAQTPEITITKDDRLSYAPQNLSLGDIINYDIHITNIGNVTLDNISVTDNNATISGNNVIANLAPGDYVTLTATHVVTQADIDAGQVVNQAVASYTYNGNTISVLSDDTDPASPAGDDDPTITLIIQQAQFSVFKDDGLSYTPKNFFVGNRILYTITVVNTGNVTLTGITVTDNNATISGSHVIANLAPGESSLIFARHTVTQSDIDTGQVANQAVASTTFNGTSISDLSDDTDVDSPTGADDPTITFIINDHDNDGFTDDVDIDDDNDGIPDIIEYNGINPDTDTDNDGVPVYLDDDDNDNTIGNNDGMVELAFDKDYDGMPNHFDLDSDDDGLWDTAESGRMIGGDDDYNGTIDTTVGNNGLADDVETSPDSGTLNYSTEDIDGNGVPDFLDMDDDNDHVPTLHENADPNGDHYPFFDATDTDGDSIPDYLDRDDDGDGIYTDFEDIALPNIYPQDGNPMNDDTDADGIPNYLDADDDNDTLLTINEHPDDNGNHEPEDAMDTDGDGIPDYLDGDPYENMNDNDNDNVLDINDLDDDNDGIPDTYESNGIDPLTDADNDDVPVYLDDDDNDNSIGDNNNAVEPAFDADGDGIPNHFDLDSDGDGLFDSVESGSGGFTDTNLDGIVDDPVGSNGLANIFETTADSGIIVYPVQDTDNDGIYDFLDIDDDNDTVLTINEHPDDNGNHYPEDAWDTNANGTPDYLDVDDDGDGTLTIDEDYNGDGGPMNDDLNQNGIPDYLDPDVTAGLEQLPKGSISVYPIPSTESINIRFKSEMTDINLKLYGLDGKLLLKKSMQTAKDIKILLPKQKGIYHLMIETSKGIMIKQILKK